MARKTKEKQATTRECPRARHHRAGAFCKFCQRVPIPEK